MELMMGISQYFFDGRLRKQFLSILLVPILFSMTACESLTAKRNGPSRKDVAVAPALHGPRQRVLILPFLTENLKNSENLRAQAKKSFVEALVKAGTFVVVDSEDLKVDFKKFYNNSEYQLTDMAKEVLALGIPIIMEGKVLTFKVKRKSGTVGVFKQVKSEFESSVRVRLLSSSSGREMLNTTKTITLEEPGIRVPDDMTFDQLMEENPELIQKLVTDAFLQFLPSLSQVTQKMGWEGRIAMIDSDKIYLNVGQLTGLNVGDILKVSEAGEDVFDPQTGTYIGKTPGRMKGTIEIVNFFGQDGAVSVIHSGAGFKENDRVDVY